MVKLTLRVISMDKKHLLLKEIRDARESGLYSVASVDMFSIVDELDIYDNIYLHMEYVDELLKDYLGEIESLGSNKDGIYEFLKAIRVGDVVDNQNLENKNSFFIGLYSKITRETAMGKLIKYANNGRQLVCDDIFDIHHTLLARTSSSGIESIRKDNDKFVGRIVDGKPEFDYFPMDYSDIMIAASNLVNLYNNRLEQDGFDNVYLQPFLIHGLLGGLQIFSDGNTRMGRIMQHALIWQLINEKMNFNFEMPPLYATRSYYPVRFQYRDKIARLVNDGSNKTWNDWFDFNLDRIEDSISADTENIKVLKRKNKYK